MKTIVALIICISLFSCTGGEQSKAPAKDSSIGVDSTKIGADSGILRKLP